MGLFLCSSGSVQRVCGAPRMPVRCSPLLPQTGGFTGQFGGATGVSLLVRLPAASWSKQQPVHRGPGGFPVRRMCVSAGVPGIEVRMQWGKRFVEQLPLTQWVWDMQWSGAVLLRTVRVSCIQLWTHLRTLLRVWQLLLCSFPWGALWRWVITRDEFYKWFTCFWVEPIALGIFCL